MKKLFLTLFALVMAIPSLWAYDFMVDGIYYHVTDATNKTVAVTYRGDSYNSYSNEYSGSVTIPSSVTYNGTTYSVTEIGEHAFYFCTGLTEVTIPNSVTSIEEYAFYGCSGLTSVTIPNSIISIGDGAFLNCSSLNEIAIPNSVTSIGRWAFYQCASLTSVTIPNSVISIEEEAFSECTGLTEIIIPNGVTEIGEYAFSGCTGLTSIEVDPNNPNYSSMDGVLYTKDKRQLITYPGGKRGSFDIPNSVTLIKAKAFSECTGLTEVTIPNGVTEVGDCAFRDCMGLTSIEVDPNNSNYSSMDGVLYNKDKTNLIAYPGGKRGSFVVPNSVTSISNHAFWHCTGLTEITIPNSVNTIGIYDFYDCSGLTSITLPNSVTSIGEGTFYNCTGLTSIYSQNPTPPTADDYTFSSSTFSEATLYISTGSLSAYQGANVWGGFSNIVEMDFSEVENFEVDGIYYHVTDATNKTVAVTYRGDSYNSYSNEYSGSVTIPSSVTYNGTTYSVTEIGESAFEYCPGLTSVTIPNSITSIGRRAFMDCVRLTSITIPESVTKIDGATFSGCTGLTEVTIPNSVTEIDGSAFFASGLASVTIPESVTKIGKYAFAYCTGLTSIEVALDNPNYSSIDGVLYNKNKTMLITYPGKKQGDFIIPNSVTGIDGFAFSGCTGLTSITIPNSVTWIGECAFEYCTGLTEITIPNKVTEIGDYAFSFCTGLTSIYSQKPIPPTTYNDTFDSSTFSEATLYIPTGSLSAYQGADVWGGFSNIVEMDFSEVENFEVDGIYYHVTDATNKTVAVTYRGDSYDSYSNEYSGSVTIPSSVTYNGTTYSVTEIGKDAFADCTGLTEATIPESVTKIAVATFLGCTGLTEITIPNSVTSIGDYAFFGCSGLTEVTIPNSVTTIGHYAFYGCTGLTEVTIPNSVTTIGECAFAYCTGLTEATIPESVTKIAFATFSGCTGLTEITIPNSVTEIENDVFFGCTGLTSIEVASDNPNYSSIDGVLYNKNKTILITYPSKKQGDFIIPNSVTKIWLHAFCYCSGLTEIMLPNSVTEIGLEAFGVCTGLTEITIPNSVTLISNGAFSGCSGLTSVTISESVTKIGYHAFYKCTGLKNIYSQKPIPPTTDNDTFDSSTFSEATLYVPTGSLSAYQGADVWENFFNIVEMDFSGVEETITEDVTVTIQNGAIVVTGLDSPVDIEVYNLQGQRIYRGQETTIPMNERGIYIVKIEGKTFKLKL